jgi:hypothetical protein
MKKLKTVLVSMLLLAGVVGVTTLAASPSYAAINPQQEICAGTGGSGGASCTGQTTNTNSLTAVFKTIVNILLFIIGAIAVIMIILGALRYVISAGDASKITQAKNTILYAVIGLVVALLAFAIVNFVLTSFK